MIVVVSYLSFGQTDQEKMYKFFPKVNITIITQRAIPVPSEYLLQNTNRKVVLPLVITIRKLFRYGGLQYYDLLLISVFSNHLKLSLSK